MITLNPIVDFTPDVFERIAPGLSRRVVLYGRGVHGGEVLERLRSHGIEPLAFCDADQGKVGKAYCGIPVLSPDDAGKQYGADALFLVAIARYGSAPEALKTDIAEPLASCGCRWLAYVPDVHETIGKFDCRERGIDLSGPTVDLGEGVRIYNFFRDPLWAVRDSFGFVLTEYLYGREGNAASFSYSDPYDRVGPSALRPRDVVIDCGANLGIFSAHAAAKKCVVHAFEPLSDIAAGLQKTAELYPGLINTHHIAVGAEKGAVTFTASEASFTGNHKIEKPLDGIATVTVDMTDLDSFAAENGIERIDFIKADIEGEERHMLRGAAGILKRLAPRLAICSYHLPDDPEAIATAIHEANGAYTIKHVNTMIYAWVDA